MSEQKEIKTCKTRCYECKQLFAYEHVYGGQVNNKMKENEEIRTVCESCKYKHNYKNLNA